MMVIVWLVGGNLGLWMQAFKHYQWANYLHFYCMIAVTIITWMSGFLAIIEFGAAGLNYFHAGFGIAIMIVVLSQSIFGMICWSLQRSARIRPDKVAITNIVHRIIGWILLIMVMIQVLYITR